MTKEAPDLIKASKLNHATMSRLLPYIDEVVTRHFPLLANVLRFTDANQQALLYALNWGTEHALALPVYLITSELTNSNPLLEFVIVMSPNIPKNELPHMLSTTLWPGHGMPPASHGEWHDAVLRTRATEPLDAIALSALVDSWLTFTSTTLQEPLAQGIPLVQEMFGRGAIAYAAARPKEPVRAFFDEKGLVILIDAVQDGDPFTLYFEIAGLEDARIFYDHLRRKFTSKSDARSVTLS
jgi:hypothetical protein